MWQHSSCVGLLPNKGMPEHYFCEMCTLERSNPFWRNGSSDRKLLVPAALLQPQSLPPVSAPYPSFAGSRSIMYACTALHTFRLCTAAAPTACRLCAPLLVARRYTMCASHLVRRCRSRQAPLNCTVPNVLSVWSVYQAYLLQTRHNPEIAAVINYELLLQAAHAGAWPEEQLQTVDRAFTISTAQLAQARQPGCQLQVRAHTDLFYAVA